MTGGTLYPMTLNDNVNRWNNINVITESIQKICGHEDQSEEVECQTLVTKNFVYDNKDTISIAEASFE